MSESVNSLVGFDLCVRACARARAWCARVLVKQLASTHFPKETPLISVSVSISTITTEQIKFLTHVLGLLAQI